MSYSSILEVFRNYFGYQASHQVDDSKHLHDLQGMQQRLEILEAERTAVQCMAQRQSVEIQELRRRLKHREGLITELKACNRAGSEELQRTREQARQALAWHTLEILRVRQTLEEVKRGKIQAESSRPARKVLPPRSLWQRSAVG
ncbi:hypothetical protein IV102_34545 [bacterium]|nr:hypothetical protein [bacterium]